MARPPYREPAPADDAASGHGDLGALRSTHAIPALHRALVAPALFAGLAAGLLSLTHASTGLIAAAGALAFVSLAWAPIRERGQTVALHARGVVATSRGVRSAVAFEDVDEVWFEIPRFHQRDGASLTALRLVGFDGRSHRVPTGVEGGPALALAVLEACSGPLLAEARAAVAEGAPLTFAGVRIDREAITIGGSRMAWSDIRLAVVSHGRVHLYGSRPLFAWRTLRLDQIPNPTVFVGLIPGRGVRFRSEDALMLPHASQGLTFQGRVDRHEAVRHMVIGGGTCLVVLIATSVTWSITHGYHVLWGVGLGIYGVVRFLRGLGMYRDAPR